MTYTAARRGTFPLRCDEQNMDFIREFAARYGITITAAVNIIIEHGIEVQRLLDDERPLVTGIVAGVAGGRTRELTEAGASR